MMQPDIFSTTAQTIAVGLNAAGRLEVSPFFTALQDRFPVFISEFQKRGRADKLTPGDVWIWRENDPWLMALIVRETPQGATRLRYVEAAMLNLYKISLEEMIRSLALMRLVEGEEWPAAREVVSHYLNQMALQATIYES
jgi:hypothetical protein